MNNLERKSGAWIDPYSEVRNGIGREFLAKR
jgi:hypothetical protein